MTGRASCLAPLANSCDDQWHLKRSKGSRHALQRHCDLHGVEPKRLISSVLVEPHCGQVAVLARSGGAMPEAWSWALPSSLIQSVVHGGARRVSIATER